MTVISQQKDGRSDFQKGGAGGETPGEWLPKPKESQKR